MLLPRVIDERRRFYHLEDSLIDLIFDLVVLPFQVNQFNFFHTGANINKGNRQTAIIVGTAGFEHANKFFNLR